MKPQDILFIVLIILFASFRQSRIMACAGIGFCLLAMVLYAKWIFFTGERAIISSFVCFGLSALFAIKTERKEMQI